MGYKLLLMLYMYLLMDLDKICDRELLVIRVSMFVIIMMNGVKIFGLFFFKVFFIIFWSVDCFWGFFFLNYKEFNKIF